MKIWPLVFVCLTGNEVAACTYDESDQLAKLGELARSVQGSTLNEQAREVSWRDSERRDFAVVYGGCDHLGHQVTVRQAGRRLLSEEQLFAMATELAEDYWWGGEKVLLKKGLESGEFTSERSEDRMRYDLTGTDYSEMYLESRQDERGVLITIAWIRDF